MNSNTSVDDMILVPRTLLTRLRNLAFDIDVSIDEGGDGPRRVEMWGMWSACDEYLRTDQNPSFNQEEA
jgi:hypothetical protein